MRIERIEVRRIHLPYISPFETSGWREDGRDPIIVRLEADGIVAWGEAPVGTDPFYSEECTSTVWLIIQEYLASMLLAADLNRPEDVTPPPAKSARQSHGQGRAGVRHLGSLRQAGGAQPGRHAGRHA